MIAFGPVPSRRLGRSLGINNIPPKICTYSCVYCQLGRTPKMQVERQAFYDPQNARSARLLERVGFHTEGTMASYIKQGDTWRDCTMAAMHR